MRPELSVRNVPSGPLCVSMVRAPDAADELPPPAPGAALPPPEELAQAARTAAAATATPVSQTVRRMLRRLLGRMLRKAWNDKGFISFGADRGRR